jgi:hypothetical protein
MTPQITQTALVSLSESGDRLHGWLAQEQDRVCDRGLLGDALTGWLEAKLEALCADAVEMMQADPAELRELLQHLAKAEHLQARYEASLAERQYWELAA